MINFCKKLAKKIANFILQTPPRGCAQQLTNVSLQSDQLLIGTHAGQTDKHIIKIIYNSILANYIN